MTSQPEKGYRLGFFRDCRIPHPIDELVVFVAVEEFNDVHCKMVTGGWEGWEMEVVAGQNLKSTRFKEKFGARLLFPGQRVLLRWDSRKIGVRLFPGQKVPAGVREESLPGCFLRSVETVE